PELVEELADLGGLPGGAGHGDLVAADMDVGVERLLHDPQQLVPGTEQADHGLPVRDYDLDLRAAVSSGSVGSLVRRLTCQVKVSPSAAHRHQAAVPRYRPGPSPGARA